MNNRTVPILAASSAVLLIVSFPNWNQPVCAWVALTPWLVLLRQTDARGAWWWSYLIGAVFFLGSLWWLVHVTVVGWIVLCAYLSLYFGAFGWLAHRAFQAWGGNQQSAISNQQKNCFTDCRLLTAGCRLLVIPSTWVALEYLRSHLLTGFGWNLLGYSQTPALTAIQFADLTGVWGVSFVIVLLNVAIVAAVASEDRRKGLVAMGVAASCVILTWHYGRVRLREPAPATRVTVAVVQGNIPQEEKWDEAYRSQTLARYEQLTRQAATQHPQIIIWPETSVPGYLGVDTPLTDQVQVLAVSVQTPLLVGAPMLRSDRSSSTRRPSRSWKPIGARLTNSAALIDAYGVLAARYDKLHLVPFGEFIPGESVMPRLRDVLPPIGDFVPGEESTVFKLQGARSKVQGTTLEPRTLNLEATFGVLICFEDIFPGLARRLVNREAQMLITITNDAWFAKTAAAYQHAQASTFRAVELRVPMVRAANTGWSGCIDPMGRWHASVRDPGGEELFVAGTAVCEVTLREHITFYARWGDWFAWLCLLGCIGWAIFAIMKH